MNAPRDRELERLAARGGTPVRSEALHFHQATTGDEERQELAHALDSGWLTTGPRTREFERRFAERVGARYAVATSSCTAGLHLALHCHGVGPGDEVITTPITFAATGNTIVHLGARPVFADVSPDTLCLDPTQVERLISDRTRAILPVHFAGHPVDLDPLEELARQRGIPLIIDAAHAIETCYRGRPSGQHGDAVAYSFYATKNITTGEGGMLVTDDEALAERARILGLHGMSRDAYRRYEPGEFRPYQVVEAGWKYNMSDLQAALGLCQLNRLDGFLARRRELTAAYDEALADLDGVTPLARLSHATTCAHHLYVVQLDLGVIDATRNEVAAMLMAEGIGIGIHFTALHLEPFYVENLGTTPGACPVAERAGSSVISLPLYPALSDRDVSDVVAAVGKVMRTVSHP